MIVSYEHRLAHRCQIGAPQTVGILFLLDHYTRNRPKVEMIIIENHHRSLITHKKRRKHMYNSINNKSAHAHTKPRHSFFFFSRLPNP
jgi:hypothetical protein